MKKKIKKWLLREIRHNSVLIDDIEHGKQTISDGTENIVLGRYECADSLLSMIKRWEKENKDTPDDEDLYEGYPIWWIEDKEDLKHQYKCKREDFIYDDGDTKVLELASTGDDGPMNTGQNVLVEVTHPKWEHPRYGFMVGIDLSPESFTNTISEREVNDDNVIS